MKTKFTWLLVALAVLALPALVQAQLSYSINNGAVTITGYNPAGGLNVVIPATIDGDPVTGIGEGAFKNSDITSVTIPNSVTDIEDEAFEYCANLTSVTIPNSVTGIGDDAFADCSSLTSVTIPNSITGIAVEAFADCFSLTSVTIPNSVTSIGVDAFGNCSDLASVSIPNSVTSIGVDAFQYCTGLTSVSIPNSVTSIGSGAFFNCTSLTNVTIPASVPNIDGETFEGCTSLTSVTIPNSVTSIEEQAFYDCSSLASVTIPASVTSIETFAFYSCSSLTSISVNSANPAFSSLNGVLFDKAQATLIQFPGGQGGSYTIPNSVTSIGPDAFEGCTSLTSVTFPASVTSIGSEAFQSCRNLTSVTIPASVTSIGSAAFIDCNSLTSAYFLGNAPYADGTVFTGYPANDPTTVYYLPNTTGWGSSFGGVRTMQLSQLSYSMNGGNATITGYSPSFGTSVVIPSSINGYPVTSIAASAFANTGITSVTIPTSVTSIGTNAFQNCTNLTSVITGNGVTSIGANAFAGCTSLTSLNIGTAVTSIGSEAFDGDTSLTTVTIPASVTSLASAAFYNCPNLASAYFLGNAPTPNDDSVFSGFPAIDPTTVYYLPGATGWSSPYDGEPAVLWIPYTYTVNGGDITITGYTGFAAGGNVAIPASINGDPVTGIAASAFYGNASLTSVSIPASVTSIGAEAFGDCPNLTSITVNPSNPDYSSLGGALFDLSQATLIQFPCGVGGSYTIPTTVTTIGPEAFYGDPTLTSVSISSNVTSIGAQALGDCSELNSITVDPNNPVYTSMNGVLFDPQTILVQFPGGLSGSYTVPNGVTSIGAYAFANCAGLTSVTIPASVTSIGADAFANCASLASANFLGNAPTGDGTAFSGDSVTVYYQPGTSGWGSSFGGGTTVLLDPFTYATNSGAITVTGYNPAGGPNVVIPSSINSYPVTSIGENAFVGATFTSVTIPNSVTTIGDLAFQLCPNLTSVTIGNGVTSIGVEAFYICTNLTRVTLGNAVTSIGELAFEYCTNLTNIIIPASVTSIGDYAFDECYGLTSAYFLGNAPPDDGTVFNDDPTTVYYLTGASGWGVGQTFGSAPEVLWNPQANAFNLIGGQFGFNLTGPANVTIVVEASASLSNPAWQPVATNTFSGIGASVFIDFQSSVYPVRFYRFRSP